MKIIFQHFDMYMYLLIGTYSSIHCAYIYVYIYCQHQWACTLPTCTCMFGVFVYMYVSLCIHYYSLIVRKRICVFTHMCGVSVHPANSEWMKVCIHNETTQWRVKQSSSSPLWPHSLWNLPCVANCLLHIQEMGI